MKKITYISGGERSGKSSYAQKLALIHSNNPIYLATAKRIDDDFEARIDRHKADRGDEWDLIEEPINLCKHDLSGRTVVLDCITLWLSNIFFSNSQDRSKSLEIAKKEWGKFIRQDFDLFVISNEIGMGVHGTTQNIRNFVELQGWMNQYIAGSADEAWFLVSGLPVKIK